MVLETDLVQRVLNGCLPRSEAKVEVLSIDLIDSNQNSEYVRPYEMDLNETELFIDKQVENWMDQDIVRVSKSLVKSPVIVAKQEKEFSYKQQQ